MFCRCAVFDDLFRFVFVLVLFLAVDLPEALRDELRAAALGFLVEDLLVLVTIILL